MELHPPGVQRAGFRLPRPQVWGRGVRLGGRAGGQGACAGAQEGPRESGQAAVHGVTSVRWRASAAAEEPSFHNGASGGPGNYPLAPVYVMDAAVMDPPILLGPAGGLDCQYFKNVMITGKLIDKILFAEVLR